MADNSAKCGTTTVRYPDTCSYVCYCTPQGGCHWHVTCGDWTTSGTGFVRGESDPPTHPSVTVAGPLDSLAKSLEKAWKRPVIVPANLRGQKIRKRTIRGTPEEIADALGIQLKRRVR